jgi:hypothetical protein
MTPISPLSRRSRITGLETCSTSVAFSQAQYADQKIVEIFERTNRKAVNRPRPGRDKSFVTIPTESTLHYYTRSSKTSVSDKPKRRASYNPLASGFFRFRSLKLSATF